MKKRVPRYFAVLAAAACLFAVLIATPTAMPTARADNLPNGYVVTCQANGNDVICNISGCPRVKGQYAGDVIHTLVSGGGQREISKSCGNTATDTRAGVASQSFNYGVQGCRKSTLGSDDCGAWSDFKYTPPAPVQVKCPAGSPVASVPQGQPCPVAAQVDCPKGSTTPKAASLDKCVAAKPKDCPKGSASATVPADGKCSGPANAVSLSVTRNGFNARIAITNKSDLPAKCTYSATKNNGVGPAQVDRNLDVDANSTGTINDLLFPALGSSYNATAKCTVTWDGKQTPIGTSTQTVSG